MINTVLKNILDVSLADRAILQKILDRSKVSGIPTYEIKNLYELSLDSAPDYQEWSRYNFKVTDFSKEIFECISTGEYHFKYSGIEENSFPKKLFKELNLESMDVYLIEDDYFISLQYYRGNPLTSDKESLVKYLKQLRKLR